MALTASDNLPELIINSVPVFRSTVVTANGIFVSLKVMFPKYFFNNSYNPPNPNKDGGSLALRVKSLE